MRPVSEPLPKPSKSYPLAARAYMKILGLCSFLHACLVLSFENFPRRTVNFGRLRRPTRFVDQLQDWHNASLVVVRVLAIHFLCNMRL